jgi:hypothetical protein
MKLDELTLFLEENGFSKNNNKTIQIDKNHIINLVFKKGPLYFQYYLVARKIKFGISAEDVLIRSSLHFGVELAKDQEAFFKECTKVISSIDLILKITDSCIHPMRFEFNYINGVFLYNYYKINTAYFLHFDENREGYNKELGFAFYSSAIHKNECK